MMMVIPLLYNPKLKRGHSTIMKSESLEKVLAKQMGGVSINLIIGTNTVYSIIADQGGFGGLFLTELTEGKLRITVIRL